MRFILIYTGSNGFPLGDAYTNRILSIAKGLISVGCEINLWIVYPGRNSGVSKKKGVFEGVNYRYLSLQTVPSNSVIKNIIGVWGILHAAVRIIVFSKKIDAIISFTESPVFNTPLSLFSRLNKILYIREVNEYPKIVLQKGLDNITIYENRRIKKSLKYFDGLICISYALRNYFREVQSFRKSILIIPIIVDIERFNPPKETPSIKYITYCGNLFGNKDGVDILIQAYGKIFNKFPEYKLQLIGNKNDLQEFKKIQKLVHNLSISDYVIFRGYVERNEIPSLLLNSSILVLARPANLQAQAGFPTKLGEYLATGKPVIVTSVGDIPRYLKDGENAYLAEPGNIDKFAEKLDFVLENYSIALKTGKNGRILAENEFSPSLQASRIKDFILNLKNEQL